MSIERRVRELGLELPAVPSPAANYVNAVRAGNLHVPFRHGPDDD